MDPEGSEPIMGTLLAGGKWLLGPRMRWDVRISRGAERDVRGLIGTSSRDIAAEEDKEDETWLPWPFVSRTKVTWEAVDINGERGVLIPWI